MINKIDFLSPPITLFHLERRTHTSRVGGFLVILMLMISLFFILLLVKDLWGHKKLTSIFHKKFEFEAGYYSFNSSSIFHFIQIFSPENGGYFDKYNSKYIRAYTTYVHPNFSYANLALYDHWVFDACRKDIDDKDLEPYLFENIDNFTNAVCIRYYFNSNERKYYSLEDQGFIWPYLEHGIAKKNNIYLTTIIQKCSNDSIINNIFGVCPSQKDIDDYLNKYFGINLYFTDMQVDPSNFTNPIQKYLQVVSTGIGNSNTFIESYLHFSPLRIKTNIGSILGTSYEINSFYFDFNMKGAANNDEKYFTITKYYHLMQNNVQIYERKYSNIFDILAEIGGVVQFIFYIFYWINYVYNKYIIAYDTNSLFFSVREDKEITKEKKAEDIKFHLFKQKSINDIPSSPKGKNRSEKFVNKKDDKIKFQNYIGSDGGNDRIKTNFSDKNIKKIVPPIPTKKIFNTHYNSNNFLLQEKSDIIEKIHNSNNSVSEENKKNENNKENGPSKGEILHRMPFSIKYLDKIEHKKKNLF